MNPQLTCEVFSLDITRLPSPDSVVGFAIVSDLPAGTLVFVSCDRRYLDMAGTKRVWTIYDETIELQPGFVGDLSGAQRQFDVASGDRAARRLFDEINSQYGSGIRGVLPDKCHLSAIVGARQRLRMFGRNNCQLSGPLVDVRGGVHVISAEVEFEWPIHPDASPTWD